MDENLSVCGLICDRCAFFKKPCRGCYETKGMTFWAAELPEKTCLLFQCAIKTRGFSSCAECSELPCQSFRELKDPNISEKEHLKALEERVHRLRKQREKC
ncbi:MAG: DUF3795 domain-containing protein [Candidatus Aminicenantales bacterium]